MHQKIRNGLQHIHTSSNILKEEEKKEEETKEDRKTSSKPESSILEQSISKIYINEMEMQESKGNKKKRHNSSLDTTQISRETLSKTSKISMHMYDGNQAHKTENSSSNSFEGTLNGNKKYSSEGYSLLDNAENRNATVGNLAESNSQKYSVDHFQDTLQNTYSDDALPETHSDSYIEINADDKYRRDAKHQVYLEIRLYTIITDSFK